MGFSAKGKALDKDLNPFPAPILPPAHLARTSGSCRTGFQPWLRPEDPRGPDQVTERLGFLTVEM